MARPTITKRFELSEAAVAELERRVAQSGAKSQTAYVEDWLTAIRRPVVADSTPEDAAGMQNDGRPHGGIRPIGATGMTLDEAQDHQRRVDVLPSAGVSTGGRSEPAGQVIRVQSGPPPQVRLCDHGNQPTLCKHAKCRKT